MPTTTTPGPIFGVPSGDAGPTRIGAIRSSLLASSPTPTIPLTSANFQNWNPLWENILSFQASDVQLTPNNLNPINQRIISFGGKVFTFETGEHDSYGWRFKHRFMGENGADQLGINPVTGPAGLSLNVRSALMNSFLRRIDFRGTGGPFSKVHGAISYGDYSGVPADPNTLAVIWFPSLPGDSTPLTTDPTWVNFFPYGSCARIDFPTQGQTWCGLSGQHCWDILFDALNALEQAEVLGYTGTLFMPSFGGVQTAIKDMIRTRLWVTAEYVQQFMADAYENNWSALLKVNETGDRAWAIRLRTVFNAAAKGCTNYFSATTAGSSDIDGTFMTYLLNAVEFYRHQPAVCIHAFTSPNEVHYEDAAGLPAIWPSGNEFIIPAQYAQAMCVLYDIVQSLQAIKNTWPTGVDHHTGNPYPAYPWQAQLDGILQVLPRMARWCVEMTRNHPAQPPPFATYGVQQRTAWFLGVPNASLYPGGISGDVSGIPASILSVTPTPMYKPDTPCDPWMFRPNRIAEVIFSPAPGSPSANPALGLSPNPGLKTAANTNWNAILNTPSTKVIPGTITFPLFKDDYREYKWLVGADQAYAVQAAADLAHEPLSVL